MKATLSSRIGGVPLYRIEDDRNVYRVINGRYTADRFLRGGRRSNFSIMHPRYAALRARIDAAIKEIK